MNHILFCVEELLAELDAKLAVDPCVLALQQLDAREARGEALEIVDARKLREHLERQIAGLPLGLARRKAIELQQLLNADPHASVVPTSPIAEQPAKTQLAATLPTVETVAVKSDTAQTATVKFATVKTATAQIVTVKIGAVATKAPTRTAVPAKLADTAQLTPAEPAAPVATATLITIPPQAARASKEPRQAQQKSFQQRLTEAAAASVVAAIVVVSTGLLSAAWRQGEGIEAITQLIPVAAISDFLADLN